MERLWEDYESIERYLSLDDGQDNETVMDVTVDYFSAVNSDYKPLQVSTRRGLPTHLLTYHRMSSLSKFTFPTVTPS